MVKKEGRGSLMPWGYWRIDPNYRGYDMRAGVTPKTAGQIRDFDCDYLLVGVEEDLMFVPGTEPKGFRWWHWDNSMQPWLRHITPANRVGHKLFSRLTHCGYRIRNEIPADPKQRSRINMILNRDSEGRIQDIAQLWGGTRPTELPRRRHALVCASSQRNHRWFGETQLEWLKRVTDELKRQGYTYTIRTKQTVQGRKTNETTHQIEREGCDLLVANYSACASEAAPIGCAVVTTSDWNPASSVSTPWHEFCEGQVRQYTVAELEDWTTRICAYTYHRHELNKLEWIRHHPEAQHLRKQRYGISKGK
jgi:hypothetical protein